MKRSARGLFLDALPFLCALVAASAAFAVTHSRLPDPMAIHFTLAGHANGFAGPGASMVTSGLLLILVAGATAFPVARAATRSGRLLVTAYGIAGFAGSTLVSVLLADYGANAPSAVRLPPWHLAVALVVASACAGAGRLAARALPSGAPAPSQGQNSRLAPADGELAAWARATGSWPIGATGLVLFAASLALMPFTGPLGASALLLGGVLCLCFARVYVTVGRKGLTVTPGRLPWPRIRIPLDAMSGASHRDISALGDFGGWGYRIRAGASGVIPHSGPALVVRRTGGREFAVTVDAPATAAALLNTLIARRKAH